MEENKELQMREIVYNSEEYLSEVVLRDAVLRKPLGLSLFDENLEAEEYDVHIGAFIHNKIVGVLILTKLNASEVKMRQVAVDEDYRNKKIGQKMVRYSEKYSRNAGYSTILLNARKSAVGFYKKLGYETISDEFLEINIPHFKMRKVIKSL
jgi:ribosomal protein S18 acetylase RimI-like enzyme